MSASIQNQNGGKAKIYSKNSEFDRAVGFFGEKQFTLIITNPMWDGEIECYNQQKKQWNKIPKVGYRSIVSELTVNGYSIYIRGTNNHNISGYLGQGKYEGWPWGFNNITDINCRGNIKYLLDYRDIDPETNLPIQRTMNPGCFAYMFLNCSNLTSAPQFPSDDDVALSDSCYVGMFMNSGLIHPPKLPAKETVIRCYQCMFERTLITKTPILNANSVAPNAYDSMFVNCKNLTFAENLPATWIGSGAYMNMFNGCENLVHPPKISVEQLGGSYGLAWMFIDCKKLPKTPYLPKLNVLYPYTFSGMFQQCESLECLPPISGTDFQDHSCAWMFYGCNKIGLAHSKSETYPTEYTINVSNTASNNAFEDMFSSSNINNITTPNSNTTYYLHKDNYIVKPNPLD